ncbi:uncharacterized protein LOC119951159 isoform X2 [Scyliorhinus canicula]|uniref:uncharacterized protein LOC119951159 isoform X2 n=1 Tax=Scyliorhinus canicula TaxID=7830 RepID=UPI0018F54B07|nr:uncharacterized protein LOC119951159 isoform X2 [Scyliorhinus canicula]
MNILRSNCPPLLDMRSVTEIVASQHGLRQPHARTLEEQNLKTENTNQTSDQNVTVTRFIRTEMVLGEHLQPGIRNQTSHQVLTVAQFFRT